MAPPSLGISEVSLEPGAQPPLSSPLSDRSPPLLTGVTRFEPRSDVRTILITGGAGFM